MRTGAPWSGIRVATSILHANILTGGPQRGRQAEIADSTTVRMRCSGSDNGFGKGNGIIILQKKNQEKLPMPPAVRRWISPFFAIIAASTFAHAQAPVRVAIVGLVHGHVAGFLPQLPKHPEVQLVGVSDPDSALRQKYADQFHLDPKIFFPSEEAMI